MKQNLKLVTTILFLFFYSQALENTKLSTNINKAPKLLKASKGATVEATFILKNRVNNLNQNIKKLQYEQKEHKLNMQNLIKEKKVYKTNIINNLYPDYLKELKFFVDKLNSFMSKLDQDQEIENKTPAYFVNQANLFEEIINKQNLYLKSLCKIKNQEKKHEFKKNILMQRKKRLSNTQEEASVNQTDLFDDIEFLENLVKKLQKKLLKLELNIKNKKNNLNNIKHELLELYEKKDINTSNFTDKNWFLNKTSSI